MNKINPTILGIDPGSRATGYGVIRINGNKSEYITSGCIKVGSAEGFDRRLSIIFNGLEQVIQEFAPNEAAIEEVFMHKNANSALKLGHARGVAMLAATRHTDSVHEYSARQIKQAVVGYGAADKAQVGHMVKMLLNLSSVPQTDAADALAVALCHAHTRSSLEKQHDRTITR